MNPVRRRRSTEHVRNQDQPEDDICLHHLFEDQARRTPDLPALAFEDQRLTYRELDRRATLLAAYLQRAGVGPEVLVALFAERSLDAIVGLLGVLKAGGAYLPIDPSSPPERVAMMLEDAGVHEVLTHTALRGHIPETARALCLDTVDWSGTPPENGLEVTVRPHHLAYVIYTSGSTGRPKGVCIEHRNIVAYTRAVSTRCRFVTGMHYATVSTMAADLGLTVVFPSITTGGCLHVMSQERTENPPRLAEYFQREQIDVLKIVPSHLAALQSGSHAGHVMPRQRLILGGEASRLDWIERLRTLAPHTEIFNHYGPTETTVGVITYHVQPQLPRTPSGTLPLGAPLAHALAYVLDAHGERVDIGTIGELWIGGRGVGRGYLNRADLTAQRFVPDPFSGDRDARMYHTGDLARVLPDGTLEFCGRVDDQIKIRGYRVEPGEIEGVLCEHAGVRDAHVLARDTASGDKQLVAYVVPAWSPQRPRPSPTEILTPATLRAHLKSRLPAYMMPSAFVLLDEFPLNANGKVDRRALPDPDIERPGAPSAASRPLTPTEATIAGIWISLLNVEHIRPEDSFFDLGGHSLMALRTMARIREAFGIEVPLRALFEGPTLGKLAEIVDGLTWISASKSLPHAPRDAGEEEIAL
jgi:amino acid adenylation domain-containing protein